MSHAIIIISRVNNIMFHVNIIMLRVDIIHLVYRKPKYATIHNKLISLKIHSKSKESSAPVFFQNIFAKCTQYFLTLEENIFVLSAVGDCQPDEII